MPLQLSWRISNLDPSRKARNDTVEPRPRRKLGPLWLTTTTLSGVEREARERERDDCHDFRKLLPSAVKQFSNARMR